MTDEKPEKGVDRIGDSSRRSFMRKGVLASSVAVLALTASGATTGTKSYQQPEQAQVFAYDYNPEMPFEVVTTLEETVVESILSRQIDSKPIVTNPGEYNGYVIYYLQDGSDLGEWALAFTRNEMLEEGQQYQFGPDAMIFVSRANLLETMLSAIGGAGGTTVEGTATTAGGTTVEGTATVEETTTGGTTTEETTTSSAGATTGTATTVEGTTEGTTTAGETTTEGTTVEGTTAVETTTAASGEDTGDGGGQASQAQVFAYDYNPEMPFEVVATLEETVVEAILGHQINGGQVVDNPDEYTGYVIFYLQDEAGAGEFALAFTRDGTLQQDQQYQFAIDAVTFNDRANLLEVGVSPVDGGGTTATTTEEGTATTEEGTLTGEATTTTEGETTGTEEGTTTTG